MYTLEQLRQKLTTYLSPKRYQHSLRVEEMAAQIAQRYECDVEKARIAGIIHDCAKNIPNKQKLVLCKKYHIKLTAYEKEYPDLLHAQLGVILAKRDFNIEDEDILDAIRYHTTGRPNMSLLEKIIYIADYIEPGRDKAPNLDELRDLVMKDLDKTLIRILEDTCVYLKQKNKSIDPKTEEAYNYYKQSSK